MQDDVSAEEQQLLLTCPFFLDIDLVEGIRQVMSPLFQDTDWVDDIRKPMYLLKNSTLTRFSFFPGHLFCGGYSTGNVSPVLGH
jgi:hypothetical protein